jgi:hypothetical protein
MMPPSTARSSIQGRTPLGWGGLGGSRGSKRPRPHRGPVARPWLVSSWPRIIPDQPSRYETTFKALSGCAWPRRCAGVVGCERSPGPQRPHWPAPPESSSGGDSAHPEPEGENRELHLATRSSRQPPVATWVPDNWARAARAAVPPTSPRIRVAWLGIIDVIQP